MVPERSDVVGHGVEALETAPPAGEPGADGDTVPIGLETAVPQTGEPGVCGISQSLHTRQLEKSSAAFSLFGIGGPQQSAYSTLPKKSANPPSSALSTNLAACPPPRQSLLMWPGLPHFQQGRFDLSVCGLGHSSLRWLSDPQLTHFIGPRSEVVR